MKLLRWFKKSDKSARHALDEWRSTWTAAIDGTDAKDAELRQQIESLTSAEPDIEVELEMLDALDQLRRVQAIVADGSLPAVETHHRVIGAEHCHFSAPASVPSDQGHAAGRVLLTGVRAVFVGGGRTSATAWHAVHEVVRLERDVLFVRGDRSAAAHFRFNTYADAAVCAFLARRLKRAPRESIIAR